jgi:hypothetical protein
MSGDERPDIEHGDGLQHEDDGSEAYGVFGEGRPRRIVGETDGPPRRRPRKRPAPDSDGAAPAPD